MADDRNDQFPALREGEPGDAAGREKSVTVRPGYALSQDIFQAATSTDDDEGIDLRALWRTLLKRKWTVVSFTVLILIAVAVATLMQTPIYRAALTLQISYEAPKLVDIGTGNLGDGASVAPLYQFYQTQYVLLSSRMMQDRVNERLASLPEALAGSERPETPRDRVEAWVRDMLGRPEPSTPAAPDIVQASRGLLAVTPVQNSELVNLYYDSPDPAKAALILNTWADVYIGQNLERRYGASRSSREFLEVQIKETRQKLEQSERALADYATQEQIVDIESSQTIQASNLTVLNEALNTAERRRIQTELAYQQVQSTDNPMGLSTVINNPLVQELRQVRAELEGEYQQKLRIYKPAFPEMLQLRARINELQAEIDREMRNVVDSIKAEYETALAEEIALRARFQDVQGEVLATQDRTMHQYNILKREVETNRQIYDSLLQQYKELSVVSSAETNNILVVDSAQPPAAAYKPDLRRNLLMALIIGLMGGVGLALLFERMDDTVKLPEDVERHLGLPVLGVIPQERRSGRGEAPTALAMLTQDDPRSAFAEAYRSVRTALQFSTADGMPKLLLVTSAAAGEGKSTTSLSLAIQLAQTGQKILLIDADLRNPSLHKALLVDNGSGLTNYLAGAAKPAEIAKPTTVPSLFLIPSGHLPPNPAELLASAKMLSLLRLATERFDMVVLDCPPVLGLADALILGNITTGTVVVVEAGGTRRGYVQGAIKRLRSARTNVLGAILTKMDAKGHGYGDYQSYYYYYAANPGEHPRLS